MTTSRTVKGDGGVELAVTEWGSTGDGRPTVLLVHGYPDTSAMWQPVADQLAARYHVVAYDVRGAGQSSAPGHTKDYRLEHLVEDMAAVADATSPDRPVHLVGHDWGSIQGWEAVSTERMAGRIASYTSIYAPGLDHVAAWIRARWLHPSPHHVRQLLAQQRRSWYIVAFHLPGAKAIWGAGLGRKWPQIQQRVEKVTPSAAYPAATIAVDGAQGIALYRANFRKRLINPHPKATTVPVQVIVPLQDHYVTPALSEDLDRWVPGRLWRTEVVAGHWLPRTQPGLVAQYVTELIEHLGGGPESPRLVRSRVLGPIHVGRAHSQDASGQTSRQRHQRHRGQVVVVTGAGSGIGRATALAFAAQGATIVAADIDAGAADETAAQAVARGVDAFGRQVDVSDSLGMEDLAKWVEHSFGGPDVVVNNAGIGMAGPLVDTTVADWDHILGVNLWGVIHGSRLFARQMAERHQGGHIVNVASAAAFTPSRMYPAYATTKSAVLMLTECLRAELADAGIGVHAICPGLVDTAISTNTLYVGIGDSEQAKRRQSAARVYQRRGLSADEVAAAILKAVHKGSAVVPVGSAARAARALSRLSPPASRRLARINLVPS